MKEATFPWTSYPLLVVDVETSGLDPEKDRVLEIAAALWHPEHDEPGTVWSAFVLPEPGFVVSDEAAKIHGITTERLQGAPSFLTVWQRVLRLAEEHEAIGCAYNVGFDRAFLRAEHVRAGLASDAVPLGLRWPWLDPLIWVREADRFVKGSGRHKLAAVCDRWRVPLGEAHTAEADAVAAGRLMRSGAMRACLFDQVIARRTGQRRGPIYDPALDVVLRRQAELGAEQDRRHGQFVANAPKVASCKSCGAPVRWVVTEAGKRIPLDVEAREDGNLWVDPGGIAHSRGQPVADDGRPDPLGPFFVAHFATCPNAAQHRTPARQPQLPMERTEGETIDGPPGWHEGGEG